LLEQVPVTMRPIIFISAGSRELRSARQLVANTLQLLGYEPDWQDVFGTEEGDLRGVLRRRIDASAGVVQLVGQCYGTEPPTADEEFGRVSYTQYEALYARKRGKKVWYLFIDENFPIDAYEPEPAELRELQATYRKRLQTDTRVFHPITSSEALEASVLKLRDDLTRLRRGVKQWAVGVVALLVFLSAATIWLVQMQRRQSSALQSQGEQIGAILERNQKMQQALVRLAQVEAQSKQSGEKPEEQRARAYAVLEKELGLSAGTLAKEMPGFALELYSRADTAPLVRARAAYALTKFDEAEKLSLEAGEQDQKAYETANRVADERRKAALESYELAGWSAEKRIQYADALEHLRKAEQLTDRARGPLEWARVQFAIGWVLNDQGQYQQVESVLREVLKERERLLGPEHPDAIAARHYIARAVVLQGRYEEAETRYRAVLKLREKMLGSEHPDTLKTRDNLAAVLDSEGKHAEAEAEYRAVLTVEEKVIGPEHPDTLRTRNNLAVALNGEGKYAEAEAESRTALKLLQKVLGPEHPDTLGARITLGASLDKEGKYAEAEAENRAVLAIEQRMLGPEHPYTLETRNDLALVLEHEGKYVEAEAEYQAVVKLSQKARGPEHPDTLTARDNLAEALVHEGNYAEAEGEYRAVLNLRQKILSPGDPETLITRCGLAMAIAKQQRFEEAERIFSELLPKSEKASGAKHPDTLALCYSYAECLKDQGKLVQAKQLARRAVEGARKVLGPDHPSTRKYEKLLQELE
jgi:tetratricopeptide (TPR) repeat protein